VDIKRESRGCTSAPLPADTHSGDGVCLMQSGGVRGWRIPSVEGLDRGRLPLMESDDPRVDDTSANLPAEPINEVSGERGEPSAESSGYTTTKQAAKALGVSRRTVQAYVRRGELEAVVEGEGVEKTFYVSIDSLDAMRERRRLAGEPSQWSTGSATGDSADSSFAAKAAKSADATGEDARDRPLAQATPELIEVVQDLQYRLGRAEAQVELTAQTESTLREQLTREQARADRLEAELLESRRPPPEPSPEPSPEPREASARATPWPGSGTVPPEPQEPPERRSWWRRFFGFE
jgi:excisionase family DNA binding protein